MNVLFISRKRKSDIGGLSRFANQLTKGFKNSYLLNPQSISKIFFLPFNKISSVHLCDATLLPVGFLFKVIFRVPLSITAHGLDITYPNPIYQWLLKKLLPFCDGIIIDSQSEKELLKSFSLPKTKIKIINPGVSIEDFTKKENIDLPKSDTVLLLTIGNLVERKGHEWFIRNVFIKLEKKFNYIIVGDGPLFQKIKQAVSELGLSEKVIMFGRISDRKLASVMEQSDIYVCPNQHIDGDFEGFGLACGEAAMFGLPVITTGVDGLSEVIQHGKNGVIARNKDFYQELIKLSDKNKRKTLGKKAKHYMRNHFSWKVTISLYSAFFQELSSKNPMSH